MVAPMNSDGEKMPPEAPEPRLIEVAHSFATKKQRQQRGKHQAAGEDRLDGRVADAVDVILSARAQKRVHHDAYHQHACGVTQIGVVDALESRFREPQSFDEGGGGKTHQCTKHGIEQQRGERRRPVGVEKRGGNLEGRLQSKKDAADESRGPRR